MRQETTNMSQFTYQKGHVKLPITSRDTILQRRRHKENKWRLRINMLPQLLLVRHLKRLHQRKGSSLPSTVNCTQKTVGEQVQTS